MNEWAEFRHFLYLSAIIEHGGVRAAAEVLHTSAPNLSAQANEFQEYFDVLLYVKGADNHILVTPAGAALPPMAHALFKARDEVLHALIAIHKGGIPTLRLGCGTLVAEEVFHSACEIHREFLPNCLIRPAHADTVHLVRDVVSGKVKRSDGIALWFACGPIIRFPERRPSEPRIFKAISEFCTIRNNTLKPMLAFWNCCPIRESRSTTTPAPLTRWKCCDLYETDTAWL
jgi:hypothetical protein